MTRLLISRFPDGACLPSADSGRLSEPCPRSQDGVAARCPTAMGSQAS